jgi:hypothetical protein
VAPFFVYSFLEREDDGGSDSATRSRGERSFVSKSYTARSIACRAQVDASRYSAAAALVTRFLSSTEMRIWRNSVFGAGALALFFLGGVIAVQTIVTTLARRLTM